MSFPKVRPVEILWNDAASTPGWQGNKKPSNKETCQCRTVGYLLRRTSTEITVAANVSEYGNSGEWMTIPVSCIKKFRRLK